MLSLVRVLHSLLAEIAKLAKEISQEFKRNPAHAVLYSLPTGEMTAARLNAELGSNGSRYPTRDFVKTVAGTAPVTRRSGKTIIVYFRWQCNKHLRGAFQDLARESIRRCTWARQYFTDQLHRGHKLSRAYRALANRWASIVRRMLQDQQPFDQSRIQRSSDKMLPTA